jgi:hypothetical protein
MSILRSFRLSLRKDNRGYGFMLSTDVRRELHRLGRSFDVLFLSSPEVEACGFCQEVRVAGSEIQG